LNNSQRFNDKKSEASNQIIEVTIIALAYFDFDEYEPTKICLKL